MADCSPELDGEAETGSIDVEERHQLARLAVSEAATVLAVGDPSARGLRHLVRVLDEAAGRGVPAERLVPVVNRSPRSPAERARLARTLASLAADAVVRSPVFVPERRGVELAHRAVSPLPEAVVRPLQAAVRLGDRLPVPAASVTRPEPERVAVRT